MDLSAVSFPALLVADDGWVQHIETKERLVAAWTHTAISKYRKRRVLMYDHSDCVWEVESITPQIRPSFLGELTRRLFNSKLPVQIEVREITHSPIQQVQEVLRTAIEADNDILTQDVEADDLKTAAQTATSYKTLVGVLKSKGAI
jgi:hypothetical protein